MLKNSFPAFSSSPMAQQFQAGEFLGWGKSSSLDLISTRESLYGTGTVRIWLSHHMLAKKPYLAHDVEISDCSDGALFLLQEFHFVPEPLEKSVDSTEFSFRIGI